MSTTRTRRIGLMVGAGLVVLGAAGFAVDSMMSRAHGARLISGYAVSPEVPRLVISGDSLPDAMMVRDFDVAGDDLYLLDGLGSRVVVLSPDSGRWRIAASFGKRGGGPGELLQPTGIAVVGDDVIVADQRRLHYFDRRGAYRRTRVPDLPCALSATHVAALGTGLVLSGRCLHADTVTADLVYVDGDDNAYEVVHDALYTMDGAFGSILSATTFYSDHPQGGLFGGGTSECLFRIPPSAGSVRADRVCTTGTQRFAFVMDPAFRAKAQAIAGSRPWAAGSLMEPDRLPVFMTRVHTPEHDLLLRPFTNDSLSFRDVQSDRDLLVAPVDGLVGCRANGCLWFVTDPVTRVHFVSTGVIAGLMRSARR